MKNKIFKPLFLALMLPVLAGCSIIDNTIATIALNMVFESKLVLNHATLKDGSFEIKEYETLPTTEANRANLTYGIEALAIPEHVAMSQMGLEIEIDFTVTYSEGAQNLFFIETMSSDGTEETDAEASVQILYPVGTLDKPTSIDALGDWVSIERLVDLKKEASKDISLTITAKAKNKTKSATYYFDLNSDGIKVPGGGEIDFEPDLALVMTEVGTEGKIDLTLSPTDQVDGKTFPLQVMWGDPTFGPSQNGIATVSVKDLATLSLTHDLTLPASNEVELISNDTVAIYTITIKLKTGQPAPTTDLVVTVAATVLVDQPV